MKKISSLLITLFLFISFALAQSKSYQILETNITSNILKSGIVDIEETRTFKFNGPFSYVFRDIKKSGYDYIYDIQVFEGEKSYLNTNKEESGNFRIESRNNFYRIYWYHQSIDEEKTFTIKYKISNPFTIGKTDAQFYWIYLDDGFEKKPGKLKIIQKFDSSIDRSEINYIVEKPRRKNKYESLDQNGIFGLSSDSFSSNDEVKLRTIFPASYLLNPVVNNEDFSLAALNAQKNNKKIASYGIMVMAILSLLFGISFIMQYLKEYPKSKKQNQPFTAFPSHHHPVLIGWLLYRYGTVSPTGILATLFELASYKKIKIEVVKKGWGIFKSNKLKIGVLNPRTSDLSNSFSKLLLDRILTIGTNTYFSKLWEKYTFSSSKWMKNRNKEIEKLKWLDNAGTNKKSNAMLLQAVLIISIIVVGIYYGSFWAFLSVIPATLFIVIWAGSRLTKEGRELHLEWHAFGDALQKNRLNIKDFDPDLLLQYCIVMGIQAEQLKSILNQVGQGDGAYLWYCWGDSGISSVSAITDIAATGTSISAVYSGGGAGGGAGGGGGGGAG